MSYFYNFFNLNENNLNFKLLIFIRSNKFLQRFLNKEKIKNSKYIFKFYDKGRKSTAVTFGSSYFVIKIECQVSKTKTE